MQLTGVSGIWTKSQVYSIQIRWMKYFLLYFIHLYFSFMNEWLQGLCHTPGILVWLLWKKKGGVCVWSLISLKLSIVWQSAFSCRLVLAHYVHGKYEQVWQTRRTGEYWKMSCAFGLHMFNFFFFLRKKSCMNETTSVYSICKNGLFWFLASTPHKLEVSVARGHI